jgi:asparagine synthase (glutamine-hydrolysing)
MCETIRHRGPDDQGIVISGRAGLGARRLSIIDIEGGHQPVANEDETIWCALNGEIYNHPDLISQMRSRGHTFRTHCDTEVIVHLYEEYGPAFVEHIDGMYAIAVWDASSDTLVLVRDRIGIKPLYYAELADSLLFGSEVKPLLMAGLPRDLDIGALDAFFTLSYIPAPHTIFAAARKLLPGHFLTCRAGGEAKLESYWRLPSPTRDKPPVEELSRRLRELLEGAVKRHLVSDVPLGAFLSGGLDSSAVVALMAEHTSRPVRTFSVGFAEESYDETSHARKVAAQYGTDHHELVQVPDPLLMTEKLAWMYDEPFADSSAVATYSVAALAKQHVTVALTGDGGDEVFGGYLLYRAEKLAGLYRRLPGLAKNSAIPWLTSLLPSSDRKTSFDYKAKHFTAAASLPPDAAHSGWKTIFAEDSRGQLLDCPQQARIALATAQEYFWEKRGMSLLDRSLYCDLKLGLPDDMLTKVDRATMAVSLEARVPLLDRSVVEFMAGLPATMKINGWQLKYLLKRAMSGVLPANIIHRRKEGFNIPVARWLRTDLRELALDTLSSGRVSNIGVLNPAMVDETLGQHLTGRVDRGREVWALLMFVLWCDQHLSSRIMHSSDRSLRSAQGPVYAHPRR